MKNTFFNELSVTGKSTMVKTVLSVKKLYKSFDQKNFVNKNINFDLEEGKILSLLGSSGCGKTTLLRLIAGFDKPDSGEIQIYGNTVYSDRNFVHARHRHIGYVVQEGILFPHMDVYHNVAYGLGNGKASSLQERKRIDEMLELTGIQLLAKAMPHELSGGQQQRVALARALAVAPKLMLLDEPFSALDQHLRVQIREEVVDILKAANAAALIVTHDREEALVCSDEIAILRDGHIVQLATPQNLYLYPNDIYTAEFIGDAILLPAKYENGQLYCPLGLIYANNVAELKASASGVILLRPEQVTLQSLTASHTSKVNYKVCLKEFKFQGATSKVQLEINQSLLNLTIFNSTPLIKNNDYLFCIDGNILFYPSL